MDTYSAWVTAQPLLSAAVQFGILGTAGEAISLLLRRRPLAALGAWWQVVGRVLAWALLGVIIKYGFTGMQGFVDALIAHRLLPAAAPGSLLWALLVSICTNVLFGPQMMLFHRLEECLILWRFDLAGLQQAWWTLAWFWIPAHTVTFALPPEYRIGLAALWSVALGVILGLTSPKGAAAPPPQPAVGKP